MQRNVVVSSRHENAISAMADHLEMKGMKPELGANVAVREVGPPETFHTVAFSDVTDEQLEEINCTFSELAEKYTDMRKSVIGIDWSKSGLI